MTSERQRMIRPSNTWLGKPGYHLDVLTNPWYRAIGELQNTITGLTTDFWRYRGGRTMYLPVTTGSISSPMGLGSDSLPVSIELGGVSTYLADSMQFMLELGCRLTGRDCYYLMPSFRGESCDETHLSQFFHSEAEIHGGLDDVMTVAEEYIAHLASGLLDEHRDLLLDLAGDTGHIEQLLATRQYARLTFEDAVGLLGREEVVRHDGWRTITRAGERRLMEMLGQPLWLTHWDHLAVPFYQACGPDGKSLNADLLLGPGEIIGCGQRHARADEVRRALDLHGVDEAPYQWYLDLRNHSEVQTSGFGLGLERFLMWLLQHGDIRDMQLVPRELGRDVNP
jgi:asparaginyl-tRNA synthetase